MSRYMKLPIVLGILLCALAVPALTQGAVWYVNEKAVAGGDGTSWATAFRTVPEAVAMLQENDEIWVSRGTYKLTATIEPPGLRDYSIYGGFSGQETSIDQRKIKTNPSIIQGDGAIRCINQDVGGGFVLDGLTIRYCGDSAVAKNWAGKLTIRNCTLTDNTTTSRGGAILAKECGVEISNSSFHNNSATLDGGAIYTTDGARTTISGCSFRKNTAGNSGGAIKGGILTITGTEFTGNSAALDGGGILAGNYGGMSLVNSLFVKNISERNGAAVALVSESDMTITNCTFINNLSNGAGGAIYNALPAHLTNTFATITNCILWKNWPEEISDVVAGKSIVTYSDVRGGFTGTGNINLDPLFMENGSFDLKPHSPCIDSGSATAPLLPATDFLGNPRIVGAAPDMGYLEFQH